MRWAAKMLRFDASILVPCRFLVEIVPRVCAEMDCGTHLTITKLLAAAQQVVISATFDHVQLSRITRPVAVHFLRRKQPNR